MIRGHAGANLTRRLPRRPQRRPQRRPFYPCRSPFHRQLNAALIAAAISIPVSVPVHLVNRSLKCKIPYPRAIPSFTFTSTDPFLLPPHEQNT
jgi:hypothetical protein